MKNIMILIRIELYRIWSIPKLIALGLFALIAIVVSLIPTWFSMFDDLNVPNLQFSEMLINIWKVIVPFSALFFGSGIISNDIKNHWLRTILSNAISRQDVYFSKIKAASLSVLAIMFFVGFLPILVFDLASNINFSYNLLAIIQVTFYFALEAGLYIAVASWLSCFVGGFMNVFFLGLWMFLDNVVIKGVLAMWLSTSTSGFMIMDFFFPSGFSEAAVVAGSSGEISTEFLLWGFAAIGFFLTVGFYHFSKINIDINSD